MDEEIIILADNDDDQIEKFTKIEKQKINVIIPDDDCIIVEEIKPSNYNKKLKNKSRKTISTTFNDDDSDVILLDEIKSSKAKNCRKSCFSLTDAKIFGHNTNISKLKQIKESINSHDEIQKIKATSHETIKENTIENKLKDPINLDSIEIQVDEITTTVQSVAEILPNKLATNEISLEKIHFGPSKIEKNETMKLKKNQSQNFDSESLNVYKKLSIKEYYLKIYFEINSNKADNYDDTIDDFAEEEENILNKVESFFYTNVLFFLNESLDLIRLLISYSKIKIYNSFNLFEKFYDYFLKDENMDAKEFKSVLTFLLDLLKNYTYMPPIFDISSNKFITELNKDYSNNLWPRFIDRIEKLLKYFMLQKGSNYAIDINLLLVQIINTLFNLFAKNILFYKLECTNSFDMLKISSNYNTDDQIFNNILITFENIILNERCSKLINNVKFIKLCYQYQDMINYCILFYKTSDKTKTKLKEIVNTFTQIFSKLRNMYFNTIRNSNKCPKIEIIFINKLLKQNEIKYAVCEKILSDLNFRKNNNNKSSYPSIELAKNSIEVSQIIIENLHHYLSSSCYCNQEEKDEAADSNQINNFIDYMEIVWIYINTYYELKSGLEQNSLMLNLFESADSICKIRESMQSLIQNLIKILDQKNCNNHQLKYMNDLLEKCFLIDEKQVIKFNISN